MNQIVEQHPVEVVTIGEPLGLFLAPLGLPVRSSRSFDLGTTGAEMNVAVGMARLGHRCRFVGRVGDDAIGALVRTELAAASIDIRYVTVDPTRPTGILVRDTARDRPIEVGYHRSATASTVLAPSDVPASALTGSSLLHLTGITAALSGSARDACRRAVALARETGARVSFDPNVRLRLASAELWREIIEEFAASSDVVLAGADDIARCGVTSDPVRWLHAVGARHVVLKRGAHGASESVIGCAPLEQPAHPVPVVDPVGAGDAFAAGWLSGWLRDLPGEVRLKEAAAVAAAAVATRGDQPGLPSATVLQSMLAPTADVAR